MSIQKKSEGVYEIRWREGGRNKSLRIHGSSELAKKIERKKMGARDENRHLDIKREVNFRMSALIDRYWTHYGTKKRSASREKSVLDGIRSELEAFSCARLTATQFPVGTRTSRQFWLSRPARPSGTSTSCTI